MSDCVICDIVAKRIPSWIVYQDAEVICFLPKSLEAYGHTIIAPKNHFQDIYSVPDDILEVILITTKRIAEHYQNQISALGINILHASGVAAQQSVPHIHFHLLPRFENDGLNTWPNLPAIKINKDELLEKIKLNY